jgi:peroxiredoxin
VIEAGATAPGFTLTDQDLHRVSLEDLLDKRLVLAFYPADFSPLCSDQLSVYEGVLEEIESRDARLVGISVDGAFCHAAFREHAGLSFPLLSDYHPKGEVSQSYGAYLPERGHCNRSLVLIERDGIVSYSHSPPHPEITGANLIFDALDAAGA